MWIEILCGLLCFRIFRRFFYDDDEDVHQIDTTDSSAIFHVANRLEKLYGGKIYVGLRIPDADSTSKQSIDAVLVTKGFAMVIAVRNFSGFVDIDKDGSWTIMNNKSLRKERHPDPVLEIKRQVAVLEAYLEQRGVTLPKGYLIGKVVLPNPKCSALHSINSLPEVISFEDWSRLKPDPKIGFSSWIKGAFYGGKGETQDGMFQKLHFILNTAPMWDRVAFYRCSSLHGAGVAGAVAASTYSALTDQVSVPILMIKLELKGNKYVLGEFSEFKGKLEDIQALRNVKRTKVSRLIIQKSTMFGGLGRSKVQVLYASRDYRNDSASDWKEATVKSSTEVVFLPLNSKKTLKIKLSSTVSMSLSA